MDEQDDYWITEIANTPEQDRDFSKVSRVIMLICCGLVALVGLAVVLAKI